jgi:hypothetical protein
MGGGDNPCPGVEVTLLPHVEKAIKQKLGICF